MVGTKLSRLAQDIATVIGRVDATTTGQYGAGIGSGDEPRQVELLLEGLQDHDSWYRNVTREVPYPDAEGRCDLQLPNGRPVECKLLRYWRANGDPEPHMPQRVLSPFHRNTLLTDAHDLLTSAFEEPVGLLGLFYRRAEDDPVDVQALPERYTAAELAEKIALEIRYWYDCAAEVCAIAPFEGLQHDVHAGGAAITWTVSKGR